MQRYAEMVLNMRDVEFNQYYNDPICRDAAAYVLNEGFKFRWHHRYGYQQWHLDGMTVDPKKLLEDESGIWMPGLEQCVIQSDLTNAGLGTVPSVQVYIAAHCQYGTRCDSASCFIACGAHKFEIVSMTNSSMHACSSLCAHTLLRANCTCICSANFALITCACAGCTSLTRG